MVKLARVLWGHRDDLKLSERWWHRLAKVLLVLLMFAGVATIAIAVTEETPSPNKGNVVVIRSLDEHRRLDQGYVVATFMAIPGRTGVLNTDGSIGQWLHDYEVSAGECMSSDPSSVGTAVTLKREPNKFDETLAQMYGESADKDQQGFVIPDSVGGKTGHCFLPRLVRNGIPFRPFPDPFEKYLVDDPARGHESGLPLELLAADRIVKWKYSPMAYVGLAALLLGSLAVFMILVLNAYYRGLIYVAFGPKAKS